MNYLRDKEGVLRPSLVYGETVYWLTIVGAVVTAIGSVLAFAVNANLLTPTVTFASIWDGQTVTEIWSSAGGVEPAGHWYLAALPAGDALAMTGMVGAILSLVPAILAVGWLMFRRNERFFAIVAVVAAILFLIPVFNINFL